MIVIDMDMPENCVECHEKGIQELLECRLIFSGCANCGRHPKCPIKCDIEQIRAEIERLHYHPKLDFIKNDEVVDMALDVINKYTAESEDKT